jgi:hypothetical protein
MEEHRSLGIYRFCYDALWGYDGMGWEWSKRDGGGMANGVQMMAWQGRDIPPYVEPKHAS